MMAKWEYLTVQVTLGEWYDSAGRKGKNNLLSEFVAGNEDKVYHPTELLNNLGEDGWEMVGVASTDSSQRYKLFFKRHKQ
jgi:hypothetical protein